MRISTLATSRKSLAVPFGDQALTVVYNPNVVTQALEEELNVDVGPDAVQTAIANAFLRKLLVEWDLEDDDGNPVPLTEEAMRNVPLVISLPLIRAIRRDMMPTEEEGKASAAGSPTAATTENPQGGSLS